MRNTHLIWIPSLQKNVRFNELTNEQYRIILKNIDDDTHLDFLYNLNKIIEQNLVDLFDYKKFTILDRFVIVLFFKILSYNASLDLVKECDKCEKEVRIRIDLNALLDNLGLTIDRSFKAIIATDNYPLQIVCDVPTIEQEYENLLYHQNNNLAINTTDKSIEKYLFGYIRYIINDTVIIDVDKLSIPERIAILEKIPISLILNIRNEFAEPLYQLFNQIIFLDLTCKECGTKFEIKMESDNMIFLLKMFFKDNTLTGLLSDYFNITSISHMGCGFLEGITPKETQILFGFAKSTYKNSESKPESSNSIDLFANAAQSPSEFAGF